MRGMDVARKPRIAKLSLALTILAVLIRVLVPFGFMLGTPANAKAGTIAIVLCTAQGQVTAFMDSDGHIIAADTQSPSHDNDDQSSGSDCVFAGGTFSPLTPSIGDLSLAFAIAHVAPQSARVDDLVPGRRLAAPPPPATASPILI
jgi:hypothetical protein